MTTSDFIKNFIQRKGLSVGFSSAFEKFGGLFLVLIATHLIPKDTFGLITYANTSLTFIIPFIGFGIHKGLIRFGTLTGSQIAKKHLFFVVLKKGFLYSIILALIIVLLTPFVTHNLKEARIYLLILSVQLISLYVFEALRVYTRLINLNKLFAQISIVKVVIMLGLSFVLTLVYGGIGYAISLAINPLLVSLYYLFKLKLIPFGKTKPLKINYKKYLSFGLFTSIGGVLSQLLYAVDLLLIANILKEEALVAEYKVSLILPFSLLFLSVVFMQTDFVKIASKSETDKTYIRAYYINYLKVFSVISVLTLVFFFFFSDSLMLLFGKEYTDDNNLMFIFSLGIVGALLLRVPLGNILIAIGWPRINALNSLIVLVFNVFFSYLFIKKYGLVGAAYVTAAMMWFSGLLSLLAFIYFLKDNKLSSNIKKNTSLQ